MNINESLMNKVLAFRDLAEALDNDIDFSVLDEPDDEDLDYTEFGEAPVQAQTEFEYEGEEYIWDKPQSDVVIKDDNSDQVWSAKNINTDEIFYFVADIDTGFIEFGPVMELEKARKFIGLEPIDQTEADDMAVESDPDEKVESLDESVLQELEADHELVRKEFGDKVYDAFNEYLDLGHDLGTVLYNETAWNDFENWLNTERNLTLNYAIPVDTQNDVFCNDKACCQGNECIKKENESLDEAFAIEFSPAGVQAVPVEDVPTSNESPAMMPISSAPIIPEIPAVTDTNCIVEQATNVMAAYQNANKWLDIIKEFLYTDLSCVFFSSYIHNLAHTMPVRFDKFGDILHTINMRVPYPPTEYIPTEVTTIDDVFNSVFMILDAIKANLNTFIKCNDEVNHGMACAAEALLNDIEAEYVPLYRMQKAWSTYEGDTTQFDKWVGQYTKEKDTLAESLVEKIKPDNRPKYQIKYSYVDPNGKFRTCYCGTVYYSERDADYALSDALSDLESSDCTEVSGEVVELNESLIESDKIVGDYFKLTPEQCEKLFNALKNDTHEVVNEVEADLRKQGLNQKQLYRIESALMECEHCPIEDLNFYIGEALNEDTIKQNDGTWTNKGDEGTHGKFDTKEKADDQRKAMFANGYKG